MCVDLCPLLCQVRYLNTKVEQLQRELRQEKKGTARLAKVQEQLKAEQVGVDKFVDCSFDCYFVMLAVFRRSRKESGRSGLKVYVI
jgi:hypothetical protein